MTIPSHDGSNQVARRAIAHGPAYTRMLLLMQMIGLTTLLVLWLTGCSAAVRDPSYFGFGSAPELPPPETTLIPTVHVASAVGWPLDGKPVATAGMAVGRFAEGLDHPRWIYVLPNGDVLVAETNAPSRPEDGAGIKSQIMRLFMKKAGAATASANRIILLRDADHDGFAEVKTVFLEGLNSPFGMALIGNDFYVANTDAIVRYPYVQGQTRIAGEAIEVTKLPAGARNHHWTKNIIASVDSKKLFVAIGSNSNAAEHGIEQETGRAAIWEIDLKTGSHREFATGLRNPVGMAFEPVSGTLWTSVNERDELGNDLVPDYMTSVRDGGFYGWPYSYFGQHVDQRVTPQRPEMVATALMPDYALGSHTASLGLVSSSGTTLPEQFQNGMFVGQHGSWNRKPRSGYKVIFVPFVDGKPAGNPVDVLTGFVSAEGDAMGRPVGVVIDKRGALLVADDVGNIIWRVSAATTTNTETKASQQRAHR